MAKTKSGKSKDSFAETMKTIVYAVLIAVVFRTLLFQPFWIPSGSMKSTLLIGDYLFISKYSYGYSKHSFPWSLGPFEGRIMGSTPERGDVAVFKHPRTGEDYIKRVVGLPGDRIQVIGGVLHINDEPAAQTPIAAHIPAPTSPKGTPARVSSPPGQPVTLITPDMPWAIWSRPGHSP